MKLAVWMNKNGVPPTALARRIGTSHVSVIRYRDGVSIPGRDVMVKIAIETDGAVRPDDFYDGLPEQKSVSEPVKVRVSFSGLSALALAEVA